jgi:hypothetical protein
MDVRRFVELEITSQIAAKDAAGNAEICGLQVAQLGGSSRSPRSMLNIPPKAFAAIFEF